jgi:hypothetical protein
MILLENDAWNFVWAQRCIVRQQGRLMLNRIAS